jgi:hypothetical protein
MQLARVKVSTVVQYVLVSRLHTTLSSMQVVVRTFQNQNRKRIHFLLPILYHLPKHLATAAEQQDQLSIIISFYLSFRFLSV